MANIVLSGIACRFAGAPSKDAFWELIRNNHIAVTSLPAYRWDASEWFTSSSDIAMYQHIRGGYIENLHEFDAAFFGINPREALLMDPQQRLLLQTVWHALEDAGLPPRRLRGLRVGIFVGAMTNDWASIHLGNADKLCAQTVTGNGFALLANRISYLLDLKGPSITVDSACSSSLLALHHATHALHNDDCDVAVAASVNAIITPTLQRFYERAGLASSDGRCKPFSRNADGIGRGEGVGAVVLQRSTEAAQRYASVRGSAVNHNGRSNGLTAPNRHAQRDVLERAWRRADVTADDVDDIECHGTGTQIGDQIELRALNDLLGSRKAAVACRLGAVKALIGHTESASGMAGLIKAALILHHRHVPSNPFASDALPALRGSGPVTLADAAHEHDKSQSFVVGVSAFGLGGTNAHVVLEAAHSSQVKQVQPKPCLIAFAGDAESVERQRHNMLLMLSKNRAPLCHVASTVRHLRSDGTHRIAVTAKDHAQAARKLTACRADRRDGDTAPRRVVFMFSGQGGQTPAMGRGLARRFPAFRKSLEQSCEIVRSLGGEDIRPVFEDESSILLGRASVAQPALFAYELAIADMFCSIGIHPDVVVGHSIGEFTAACVAGAYDATQCLRILVARGALIDAHGGTGGMLALHIGATQLKIVLGTVPSLCVAAYNGPMDVVVAGDETGLTTALAYCAQTGIKARRIPVTHSFHSPLMHPVAPLLADVCRAEIAKPLRLPMLSTVSGQFLDAPPDADYWTQHLVKPVLFVDACHRLAESRRPWLGLEMGPRPALAHFAETMIGSAGVWLACTSPKPDEIEPLLTSVGTAWKLGCDVSWAELREADAEHIPLPPYPFQPTSFWHRVMKVTRPDILVPIQPVSPTPHTHPSADIEASVIAILATVIGIEAAAIRLDDRIAEDLGLDSINIIEVVSSLESTIGEDKMPPLDELANVSTVRELICTLSLKTELT